MKRWSGLWLGCVLAGCGGPAAPWTEPPAAALDLRIDVAATTVPLLEPVTVHLDLFWRDGLEVEFAPQVAAEDFAAEVRSEPARPLHGGSWRRTTLVLRPARGPGELVLPPFTARAKDGSVAASTPEQRFTVTSLLDGQPAEVEAPGAPFPPAARRWPVFAVAGGLALALAAAWWLTRARARPSPGTTLVPPHTAALRALARLRTAPRASPAEIERFYVEVSAVLRTYLEDRFGLRAPERTTEEFLRELESGDRLARDHRAELERFLSHCDLVKFAAHVPAETEHLATFLIAETFVERTRPDRAPVEAAP